MILKKTDLISAYEQKNLKNFEKALELFEKFYSENPDVFTYQDKVNYAWTIIFVRMSNEKDEDLFLESAEYITQLLPQADLNASRSCPYTAAVFKVLKKYKGNNDCVAMIPWLDKLDPELLDEKPHRSYGRQQKSRKETYYSWASMAYLNDFQPEKCIEVCRRAMDTLTEFHDDSYTWFQWRIAKSLNQLGRLGEALPYLLEVIKVKHDWYMYRDIAEIYYTLNKPYKAMDYLCLAILARGSPSKKMGVYYLCYKVFRIFNQEMALKHAQLYYLLLKEKGYSAPYEIEQLNIDESQLNRKELESEITDLWIQYKHKDCKRQHGTVVKFFQDRSFGFIRTEDDEDIFFHKDEFEGENVYVGQLVSFYTEENFDKSKNRKSVKAVIVRGE